MNTLDLLPADLDFGMQLNVAVIAASPLAAPIKTLAAGAAVEIDGMFQGFSACGLDTTGTHVFLGGHYDSADDQYLLILESPGIGSKKKVNCLERALRKATGEGQGLLSYQTRGPVLVTPQEGGGWLIILNKNVLVVTSEGFMKAVFERIEKPETRTQGRLAKAMATTDNEAAGSVTMIATEFLQSELELPGVESLRHLNLVFALQDNLITNAQMHFETTEQATAMYSEVAPLLEEAKPAIVDELGLSEDLVESLTLEQVDTSVELHVTTTLPDLMSILALANE